MKLFLIAIIMIAIILFLCHILIKQRNKKIDPIKVMILNRIKDVKPIHISELDRLFDNNDVIIEEHQQKDAIVITD